MMATATDERNERTIEIDLDQALQIDLPALERPLTPATFRTPDGLEGWVLGFAERRPIATPAYADGKLFVGAGYGSYRFCAFDALSGQLVWEIETADDGPSAAVVEDGFVAFSTESCTIMVCEAETGRKVWEEWLGDPLMSQPAIADGKLFIAFPADQFRPQFTSGMTMDERRAEIAEAKRKRRPAEYHHRMLCADLRSGEHLWETEIAADVIAAPIVNGGQLFFTCFEGTSFCLNVNSGEVIWRKQNAGTCSPLIMGGRVVMMHKESRDGVIHESLKRSSEATGEEVDPRELHSQKSPYLHEAQGGGSGLKSLYASSLDAAVGFSSAPSSAKLAGSAAHLGVGTVSGAWAYQGSRPAQGKHGIYNAQGNAVYCLLDDASGQAKWRAEVKGSCVNLNDQVFLPPAMGRDHLYLTSLLGHLLSVHQETGTVKMLYSTNRPIAFQPIVAGGSLFAGTSDGYLLCLKTGNDDADGWYMWGGNAQHNLSVTRAEEA